MRNILADCRLYGIVDTGYLPVYGLCDACSDLIEGGVQIIQLRAKGYTADEMRPYAMALQVICRATGTIFVLNDHIELAAELGVDALHVGQDEGSLEQLRAIVGEEMIIGRSTHAPEQAIAARAEGFDYIGFGPLFPTGTKPGRASIGLQDLATVQESLGEQYPIFAIGGINEQSLQDVLSAGAKRVVIVSWLLQQQNISVAAKSIISSLNVQLKD